MKIHLKHMFWRMILRKMFKNKRMEIIENRVYSSNNAKRMNRAVPGVEMKSFHIGQMPAAWILPANAEKGKVILHLHGGGYVLGGIESSQMMSILMAQVLGRDVLLPEYRLAPEHPFPAAVEDAVAAYRWLLAQGYDSKQIVVCGDSAGGGLSLAMTMMLRDAGDALPAAIVCLSPWTDLTFGGASYQTKEKVEPVLREDVLRMWAEAYRGGESASHPHISPMFGNFRAFPPLLIQVGSDEILLDDSIQLAEKAKSDGAPVTVKVWDGMWHVWHALGDAIPESARAFEEVRQFVSGYDNCH